MFNFNSASYEDVLKALKGLDDINVLHTFLQTHDVDETDENGKIFILKILIQFNIVLVISKQIKL